jgi:hypothetical protein
MCASLVAQRPATVPMCASLVVQRPATLPQCPSPVVQRPATLPVCAKPGGVAPRRFADLFERDGAASCSGAPGRERDGVMRRQLAAVVLSSAQRWRNAPDLAVRQGEVEVGLVGRFGAVLDGSGRTGHGHTKPL